MAVCLAELELGSRVTPEGQRIARVFKELRREARLTQEEAAERVGLTLAGYRPYEQGKRQLRTEQFSTFARAFGVPPSVLTERLRLSPSTGTAEPALEEGLAAYLHSRDKAAAWAAFVRRYPNMTPDQRRLVDALIDHLGDTK